MRRKTVKKFTFVFSFLLVFILLGANSVSAADHDGLDSVMLENEDMGLSQVDDIGLNDEDQILKTVDQANLCESYIGDSEDETANYLDKVDEKLILEDSANKLASFDDGILNSVNGNNGAVINPLASSQRTPTKIVFKDMKTTAISPADGGKTGEYFTWRLLDENGNPMANTPMQIGFNGVVYTFEKDGICTDENGYAKLQINLGYKGDYTFAICLLGNDDYNASFAVAKITVDTQKPTLVAPNKSYAASAKTKTLTATFKSAKGNPIKDKWITFKVNGKTYKAQTNAKGVASVNVSLNKKGTYSFTAKYAGDSTYKTVNKTGKLIIK